MGPVLRSPLIEDPRVLFRLVRVKPRRATLRCTLRRWRRIGFARIRFCFNLRRGL